MDIFPDVSTKYRLVSVFFFAILFSSSAYSGPGTLTIKNLPDAEIEDIPVCFDLATGQLGQCESSAVLQLNEYRTPVSVTRKTWVWNDIIDGVQKIDTCDDVVEEYSRSDIAGGTRVETTVTYNKDDGTLCGRELVTVHVKTSGEYLISTEMLNQDLWYTDGLSKINFDSPFNYRPATTKVGVAYGDGKTVTQYYPNYQGEGPMEMKLVHLEKRVIIGIEDITVPAGTFTDCLKEFATRASTVWWNEFRIRWLCPGVGLIKYLRVHDQTGEKGKRSRSMELVSYQ